MEKFNLNGKWRITSNTYDVVGDVPGSVYSALLANGLMEEVQALIEKGISKSAQCMQGIGYKEIVEGLETGASIDEMKELIKKNTRNYAKRQITFFKRMKNHVRLSPKEVTVEKTIELCLT